jgi:hypothetical protein
MNNLVTLKMRTALLCRHTEPLSAKQINSRRAPVFAEVLAPIDVESIRARKYFTMRQRRRSYPSPLTSRYVRSRSGLHRLLGTIATLSSAWCRNDSVVFP